MMKRYLVGGAVRDELLGVPIKERDWVVVGATPDDLRKKGYKCVGREFPVFLHPKTQEEHALARTERKTGKGYRGFVVDASNEVTLEEDLIRRDLTINAMAKDENGKLIDPYHGYDDLQNKILRHVSPAFSEDPVRLLRVARFMARFHELGFYVHPDTLLLMQKMVDHGEVDALVPERVFRELSRALVETSPEQFFITLEKSHALKRLFPEINLNGAGVKALAQFASHHTKNAVIAFALLLHDVNESDISQLCSRIRVPNEHKTLAILLKRHHAFLFASDPVSPASMLEFLMSLDAFRRKERFLLLLQAAHYLSEIYTTAYSFEHWKKAYDAANRVDIKALVAKGLKNAALGKAIYEARMENLKNS